MTKGEQARLIAWRHRILQFAADERRSVSKACRHFGISRKTFYKWKARYGAHAIRVHHAHRGIVDRTRKCTADGLHALVWKNAAVYVRARTLRQRVGRVASAQLRAT